MVSQIGNIHCVTFGSPRVGDIEFARLFNATVADIESKEYFSCRFTTEDDPIPQGMNQVQHADEILKGSLVTIFQPPTLIIPFI